MSTETKNPTMSVPGYQPLNLKHDVDMTVAGEVWLWALVLLSVFVLLLKKIRRHLVVTGRLPEASNPQICVLDRLPLSSRQTACLLELDGERILVVLSPGHAAIASLGKGRGDTVGE